MSARLGDGPTAGLNGTVLAAGPWRSLPAAPAQEAQGWRIANAGIGDFAIWVCAGRGRRSLAAPVFQWRR